MNKRTVWTLVGSEDRTESAENSGLLLLEEEEDCYRYEIIDGNNIRIAKGEVPFPEQLIESIVDQEGVRPEYVELAGEGDEIAENFIRDADAAGKYLALWNPDQKYDDDEYIVIRTSDNAIVDHFKYSGDAYDTMCVLNLSEEESE